LQEVWLLYEVKNKTRKSKMSNREMVKEMTKDEAIAVMLESINADNLALGLQAGLKEEDLKTQIEQSQQSLNFMMSNIYDKLKEGGAIA
jgi:hypothetical protein